MPQLINWMLVFTRVSAMFSVFPIFSARNFPVQMRLALGAIMAALICPSLPPTTADGGDFWGLAGLLALEAGAGLLLGFMARIIFFAIDLAGAVAATEIGLSLPAGMNPLNDVQSVAPGLILYYLAAMIWFGLDLHLWLLAAFQKTYTFLPIGGAHLSSVLVRNVVAGTGGTFLIALQLVAPVMAVSFIMSLVFAVLGRAVPQMNVFSESFFIRIIAGLSVFGLTMQLMSQHIINYLRQLPEDMLRLAQLLGAG